MSDPTPFSTTLRDRCNAAHDGSEHSGFMKDLMRGLARREDYIALVVQHWYLYSALEAAAERMRQDPIATAFISDRLTRVPALEADLAFLVGPDWREQVSPLPSTQHYVDRIDEVGVTWAGGFVAHHYTRYLGDLSGGLHIGRAVARAFGFDRDGVGFYAFDEIADPTEFKNAYRRQLDTAPWPDAEQEQVIDEVLLAYRFNTEMFTELTQAGVPA